MKKFNFSHGITPIDLAKHVFSKYNETRQRDGWTNLEKIKKKLNSKSVAGYVFTAPLIFGFLFFLLVPMIISMYYSFCDYNILSPAKFSGLANYKKMITDDTFWLSLKVTFYFAFVSVPLKLIFALFVAMLLLKNSKLSGFYRAAYYLPSVIGGSVAVAVLWKRMFAMDGVMWRFLFRRDGIVNLILQNVGLPYVDWIGSPKFALGTVALLAVWQFGSSMLIFLSALKQIPASLYEAADIDGAGKTDRFFRITLPLLTPNIFFNLVMQLINGFLAFSQCYIITQGKPMNSTLLYTVYMYQQSFEYYNTGYGAALAWVMLIIIGTMTAVLFATKKFWVYEGGF